MASINPGNPGNNNADFKAASMFDVKNRVAIVSGGGSGIGLMCTQALAVNGAKVLLHSVPTSTGSASDCLRADLTVFRPCRSTSSVARSRS